MKARTKALIILALGGVGAAALLRSSRQQIMGHVFRDPVALYHLSQEASDPKEAWSLLVEAAERGHVEALGQVGLTYSRTARNSRKAAYWLTRASEAGHVEATTTLAEWHRAGISPFDRDPEHAKALHRAAARRGGCRSMVYLVTILAAENSDESRMEAREWLSALAQQASEPTRSWAQERLGGIAALHTSTSVKGE